MNTTPSTPSIPRRRRRTLASAAFVTALAAAGVGLGAPSATADTVSVGYTCTGPGAPDGVQSLQVTVTAPASVPQGGTAELALEVTTELKVPLNVPAHSVTGDMTLELGGAASGSVTATGFTNPASIPSGSTVTLTGGTASAQLDTAGTTTFTPGEAAVHVFGVTVACTVSGTAPVAATTEVTGA
ncbi:hypothetical protein ABZ442_10955 [Streptomyces triculaminicus]|uniref:hypothetical protein n=1 Tax=Streptomyces triculaminicus TaxID=2816232 RepID=UPI0033CBA627